MALSTTVLSVSPKFAPSIVQRMGITYFCFLLAGEQARDTYRTFFTKISVPVDTVVSVILFLITVPVDYSFMCDAGL